MVIKARMDLAFSHNRLGRILSILSSEVVLIISDKSFVIVLVENLWFSRKQSVTPFFINTIVLHKDKIESWTIRNFAKWTSSEAYQYVPPLECHWNYIQNLKEDFISNFSLHYYFLIVMAAIILLVIMAYQKKQNKPTPSKWWLWSDGPDYFKDIKIWFMEILQLTVDG